MHRTNESQAILKLRIVLLYTDDELCSNYKVEYIDEDMQ